MSHDPKSPDPDAKDESQRVLDVSARPRMKFRVNGARAGDAARPAASTSARLPTRRAGFHAALSTRPNTYCAPGDDDEAAS